MGSAGTSVGFAINATGSPLVMKLMVLRLGRWRAAQFPAKVSELDDERKRNTTTPACRRKEQRRNPGKTAPENSIYMCLSDDRGVSFSTPQVIASSRDGFRAFDPALWLAPDGRLWLVFCRGNRDRAEHGVYARLCAEPDAAVPIWGEEFRLGYDAPFCFRLNKPTALSTGEWLMPVTHTLDRVAGWFGGEDQLQGVGISEDQGHTWILHGAVEAPGWALENMIVERTDGRLVMYIRTGAGVIWESVSDDHGRTWAPGKPTTIANPGSRFFVRRLPDGDWLLINNPDPTSRTGIVACLSTDEGATWQQKLVLDPRDSVSYPDAALGTDGTIYVVHDRDRQGAGEILLNIIHRENFR